MASLELQPDLADDFTSEPVSGSHVAEVYSIVSAEQTLAFGFCSITVEDVRAWITPPDGGQSAQSLVRSRDDRTPAQWWAADRDPGGETVYASVRSHPRLPEAVGDRLTAAGWVALFSWIRNEYSLERAEIRVQSGRCHGDQAAGRRLHMAGFAYARTFWEMTGPVSEASYSLQTPEGLTINATRDAVAVHRVLDEAFADHWGYEVRAYEDWWAVETWSAGHDLGLWRLVELDGLPVAAMIMSRRGIDEGSLYVQELATLAPYRRRGIASALLRHAFDVAGAEGLSKVALHVDSSNSHNAPSVYRRAGLDVRSAFDAFTRTLVPGSRR